MSSLASSPATDVVTDELWALIEPLIPPRPPAKRGRTGRPRRDDRAALEGIVFVLRTGTGWAKLPLELGYGSGWTCWRRLREWQDAGVWEDLHRLVLDELARRGDLDWSRCSIDSVSVRAKRGATSPAPTPLTGANAAPAHALRQTAGGSGVTGPAPRRRSSRPPAPGGEAPSAVPGGSHRGTERGRGLPAGTPAEAAT
jgi:transposase